MWNKARITTLMSTNWEDPTDIHMGQPVTRLKFKFFVFGMQVWSALTHSVLTAEISSDLSQFFMKTTTMKLSGTLQLMAPCSFETPVTIYQCISLRDVTSQKT